MNGLSAQGLADLAGVTEAEIRRLVDLGILVARDGAGPFLETDVQKVRLATACEQAGLPMDGIAAAVQQGRLSFAFLEAAPYRRWAVRSARTYRQGSQGGGGAVGGSRGGVTRGGLSFAFLEAAPYRRWAVRSARTYRQVSQEAGVPLELLGSFLEGTAVGPVAPDDAAQ